VKGLREIVLIHDLKKQGLSISAIARKVGSDRKTVRKYLNRGLEAPVYGSRQPRARVIEPYERYLQD
jgi:transposase